MLRGSVKGLPMVHDTGVLADWSISTAYDESIDGIWLVDAETGTLYPYFGFQVQLSGVLGKIDGARQCPKVSDEVGWSSKDPARGKFIGRSCE